MKCGVERRIDGCSTWNETVDQIHHPEEALQPLRSRRTRKIMNSIDLNAG